LKTGLTGESAKFLPIDVEPISPQLCFEQAAALLKNIRDPLDWACRMDLITYLPDDLMVKADRASMAVGLELREPLLHYGLVEWGLTLPMNQRFNFRNRQGKRLARRYLSSRVPKTIVDRDKQGFTPPLSVWLNGPLKEWREQAVCELESGRLAPLSLPFGCRNWFECADRLNDAHHQFLWRIICFSGWKTARKRALAARSQDFSADARLSVEQEQSEPTRRV
jgi:asparagine synthetase B (glutamine-hydrolysing)